MNPNASPPGCKRPPIYQTNGPRQGMVPRVSFPTVPGWAMAFLYRQAGRIIRANASEWQRLSCNDRSSTPLRPRPPRPGKRCTASLSSSSIRTAGAGRLDPIRWPPRRNARTIFATASTSPSVWTTRSGRRSSHASSPRTPTARTIPRASPPRTRNRKGSSEGLSVELRAVSPVGPDECPQDLLLSLPGSDPGAISMDRCATVGRCARTCSMTSSGAKWSAC